MYADYLSKVAMKKINAETQNDEEMDPDEQDDESKQHIFNEYEMEESKEEKAKSMKSGEKYIIRKLLAFKINIPKIDDYIQKVSAIEIKNEKMSSYTNNNITNPIIDSYYQNSSQPIASNIPIQSTVNPYLGIINHNNLDQFKTMQGFNDDSQVAFYAQNFLFQNPSNNQNAFMAYNNNLIASMQNLSLNNNNNQYWNNMPYQQNTGIPQMNMNNMQYYNQWMQNNPQTNGGFNNYTFPMNPYEGMQNFNIPNSTNVAETNVLSSQIQEESKEVPLPMRLPNHMKKAHFRSHSVTPVETGENMDIKKEFLHGQVDSPIPKPKAMRFEKICFRKI